MDFGSFDGAACLLREAAQSENPPFAALHDGRVGGVDGSELLFSMCGTLTSPLLLWRDPLTGTSAAASDGMEFSLGFDPALIAEYTDALGRLQKLLRRWTTAEAMPLYALGMTGAPELRFLVGGWAPAVTKYHGDDTITVPVFRQRGGDVAASAEAAAARGATVIQDGDDASSPAALREGRTGRIHFALRFEERGARACMQLVARAIYLDPLDSIEGRGVRFV